MVFDKSDDRRLVGHTVVYEVDLRVRRDHQQRKSRTVAATPLAHRVSLRAAAPPTRQAVRTRYLTRRLRARKRIIRRCRLIHDRTHHVIIPAVGIVPHDDYRGVLPLRELFYSIDRIDQEVLFIERVGLNLDSRMTVLIGRRFEETYRW